MPNFKQAGLSIIFILVVHVVAIVLGWYDAMEWFDIPMHFAGGFAIAMLALASCQASLQKITFQKTLKPIWRGLVPLVGVLGTVALVGVAWEWYEFIFDSLMVQFNVGDYQAQMGLGDTLADLALDLVGAWLAFTIFCNRYAHRPWSAS